ncbi:MAG TPA: hypothetical protein VF585_06240 [Chthoniobacterales bacterium]
MPSWILPDVYLPKLVCSGENPHAINVSVGQWQEGQRPAIDGPESDMEGGLVQNM